MFENVLLWIKNNYEKLILYCLLALWLIIGINLLLGWDKQEELNAFEERLKPPPRGDGKVISRSIYNRNLEGYLMGRPFSYYEPLYTRNPFFPLKPLEIKKEKPKQIEMNLECIEITASPQGLVATLKNTNTEKVYKAKEGEEVEGWMIVDISKNSLTLERENERHFLSPPTPEMNFKLTGTAVFPDEGHKAFLRNIKTGATYIVGEGDVVEGWKILEIGPDSIKIFREGAPKYELKIGG